MKIHRLPQELKAIIFDMDGTLYSSPEYIEWQDQIQIAQYAKEKNLDPEATKKEFDAFRSEWAKNHGGKKISLANTFVEHGIPIQKVFQWRDMLADPENYIGRDQALIDSLLILKEHYTLVVVTNNSTLAAKKTLAALGIDEIITDIIGLDVSQVSKPHKRPFELALQKAGCTAEQALSIGDRYDIDIALPLEMGMGGIEVKGAADIYNLYSDLQTAFKNL